jgi:hypothetical protein
MMDNVQKVNNCTRTPCQLKYWAKLTHMLDSTKNCEKKFSLRTRKKFKFPNFFLKKKRRKPLVLLVNSCYQNKLAIICSLACQMVRFVSYLHICFHCQYFRPIFQLLYSSYSFQTSKFCPAHKYYTLYFVIVHFSCQLKDCIQHIQIWYKIHCIFDYYIGTLLYSGVNFFRIHQSC